MSTRRQAVKAANEQARRALEQKSANGKQGHLGDLAFWTTESAWRMPCPEAHRIVRAHGIDPVATLPAPTNYAVAFGRAVDSVRAAIHSLGYTLLDAAPGPNGERRVSVLKVARNGVVSTQDEGCILCPTDGTNPPQVERTDPGRIVWQILDKTKELHDVYMSRDIGLAIVTLFTRWAAMPCTKGVYFLPPNGSDEVERFSTAMQEMGAGEISQFAGYEQDARSAATVARAVNQGLEANLTKFAEEAEEYVASGKVRPTTIEGAIVRAKHLKVKAELYRTILGAAVTSVDEKVARIEQALRDTLGTIEARP